MVVEKESENPTACGAPWGVPAMMEPGGALPDTDGIFKKLAETTASAIMIYQEERWIYANPAAERMTGYASDELKDMKFWDICHAADREFIKKRGEARKRGESLDSRFELRFIRKNGEERWVDVTGDVIMLRGQRSGIVTAFDITERKRMESQLLQAQKMEAIGTLAGGIAHDFNNLLMGILGNASLAMMDMTQDDRNYERMQRIETQVLSGANLTKQLLGFARGGRYEVKPTDINGIIAHSVEMFGRTRKEISIEMKFDENIWNVEVDRGQMEQVFINLFLNASHAMPEGGDLCLETKNVSFDKGDVGGETFPPGKYVRIIVADTGVGMDEKTLNRIFDPFFTTRQMGRGTGLGLSMVYGIVRGHGGGISVESAPGRGTRFLIYLPASQRETAEERMALVEVRRGTETILLVEDEAAVMDVGGELLESIGHRVFKARNGSEALALYREKRAEIDIVILDMIMPGISGSQIFDRLKEMNPEIRVILASGYSINGEAQEIMDRGCCGFLQKPFSMASLSGIIREVMDV
jgi:PAS domain S-box-containing protein